MRNGYHAILLVEDNQDDAEFAVSALRDAGISGPIDLAEDGEGALEYLMPKDDADSQKALPTVVLLDIKLPKIDGLEVLRRIRATPRTRCLPTVILSSSDVPEDVERAYALGANSYVRKPVEFSKYEETLRTVGQYWTAINERLR